MKKAIFLVFSICFLFYGCNENRIPLRLAKDIVNCNIEELDLLLENNRPITDLYLDSILKTKPSDYFRSSKSFFNQKASSLVLKGGNYNKGFLEYYINYSVKKHKFIEFTFIKKEERWKLVSILPQFSVNFSNEH